MVNISKVLLEFSCQHSTGIIYSFLDLYDNPYGLIQLLIINDEPLEARTLARISALIIDNKTQSCDILFWKHDEQKVVKLQSLVSAIEKTQQIMSLCIKQVAYLQEPIIGLNDLMFQKPDIDLKKHLAFIDLRFENKYQKIVLLQFQVSPKSIEGLNVYDLRLEITEQAMLDAVIKNNSIRMVHMTMMIDQIEQTEHFNHSVYDLTLCGYQDFNVYESLVRRFKALDFLQYMRIDFESEFDE